MSAGSRILILVHEHDGYPGRQVHQIWPAVDIWREQGIEVLVFDMQDVGARFYTYVSTMAYAMEAAGEHDISFVVLDRPNPIRGDVLGGNVLDPESEVSQILKTKRIFVLKEEAGTLPRFFYYFDERRPRDATAGSEGAPA